MSATPPRDWNAIKAVFFEAMERRPKERDAYLLEACGADADMRSEVASLLAAHDDGRPFLDVIPVEGAARVLSAALEDSDPLRAPLPPGTRIGPYEVVEPLGSGGMGDVYRARDTKLDRMVALKIVRGPAADRTAGRVLQEARAASALNHPNICTLYEAGEFDGQPYLAMEYIAGEQLSSIIPAEGFDAADVLPYGIQIADALAHAHEHGVIHRDLKSANIVVTTHGRAKVLDFGIARRVIAGGDGAVSATLPEASTAMGTLAYMAPELLRDRAADARTDIWALGVVLYEIAAGTRPFTGTTTFDVTSAILHDPPLPLPAKLPSDLRAVIVRCLARDPDDRFQHASDVMAALKECSHATGTAASRLRARRRALLGAMVAAATIALAAYLGYQWRTSSEGISDRRPPSLAVLPFRVLSGAEDVGFLGLGVPDTIISRIAEVRSIRIKAVLGPGKEGEDPQALGRRLDADYVLTGSIEQADASVRITPHLVRVNDGAALWTRTFTLSPSDLLPVQDGIPRAIVEALPVRMTSDDRVRLERQYTRRAEAYKSYMRGRSGLARNDPDSVATAVASFQSAVEQDRTYVFAYAGLAMASARMRLFFAKENEVQTWHKRAHQAAQRALQIEPDLAQTHEALAAVYRSTEFDWPQTIQESTEALERNPSLDQSHLFRASAFMHLGLLDRAAAEATAAMDINPANMAEPLRVQGAAAMYAGGSSAAVALLERASAESNAPAEWNLAYAYHNAGRKDEAEAMLRRIRGSSARSQRRAQATLASFLAANGRSTEAAELIDVVIAGSYMDHHVAYSLGAAYAQLGRPREAMKWLAEARTSGFPCYPWFEQDPLLSPLRRSSVFQSFLDEFKQSWETKKAQLATVR
jgi:eukaryotic-like serine/threonine-protein kinase